jgi:LuxR family transcriptional regulator, maltose regulon positive regulatory protein
MSSVEWPRGNVNTRPGANEPAPGSHGLAIRCFGNFEVLRDGSFIQDWRRDKSKALLKLLIAHHGSIQRDVLLELLWPEVEPEPALRNLRVTLHALRRALGSAQTGDATPYVLTRGDAYQLNPGAPVWVDAEAFSTLYELAAGLWRLGREEESLRAYEAAEKLYRDDYLLDDLYEEWTCIPREQFKDRYLTVVTRLADAALSEQDLDSCIEYCHKILARDASREDAYQRLMRCHAEMGRPARALRWYELCRETLWRDLNVPPSALTIRLAATIAGGGSASRMAEAAAAS